MHYALSFITFLVQATTRSSALYSMYIIFTVTQQKNKLETVQWKKPIKRNDVKE